MQPLNRPLEALPGNLMSMAFEFTDDELFLFALHIHGAKLLLKI